MFSKIDKPYNNRSSEMIEEFIDQTSLHIGEHMHVRSILLMIEFYRSSIVIRLIDSLLRRGETRCVVM